MSGHTQLDVLLPETLMIKQSCNLIGQEHFDLKLVNQNFSRHGVCTGKVFHFRLLPAKRNDKSSFKVKKNSFFSPFCPF